jgi:hypothetical protein
MLLSPSICPSVSIDTPLAKVAGSERNGEKRRGRSGSWLAPYPVSYRAIIPRQTEASNLFVPICLSATHIAYGSIRMEPVFMVLGQSLAIAAGWLNRKKQIAPKEPEASI